MTSLAMKVKGVVRDDQGNLPGASVTIKGTLTGTESDDEGNFEIEAKPGQTLVVEFLGYDKKEVVIPKSSKKPLTINLSEAMEALQQVEIVAQPYGGTGGSTGSTTTLGADKLKSNTSASIDNALQGRVAGVSAASTSGQPGAPANIRIHGQASLTGSGDPLYVVDGMPLGGGTDKTASSNPLASINPADIESMEVLKDASATAIYGSRAANGVIIIKTKKGKKGDAKITYSGNFTVSQFSNRYDMMNLQEYAQYLQDNYDLKYGAKDPETLMQNPSVLGEGTDWQDELFQTAIGHSHQLSVNGGSDNTQYNISLGYMNSEGVMITTDYERINGRMNVESQVKKWLRMGMNIGVSRQNSHSVANIVNLKAKQSGASCVPSFDTDENIIMQTLMQLPSDAPYDLDGSVSGPESESGVKMNPIAALKSSPVIRHETNILGSTFLEFTIAKHITWRNEFGIDVTNADDSYYQPSYSYGALTKDAAQAELDKGAYSNSSMRFSSYANYTNTFAKRHRVNFMLGAEANEFAWEGSILKCLGYSSNAIHTPNLASSSTVNNYYRGEGSMASFFGRVNYSFDNRYDLTASGRYDGSSNFAEGNQWGFFPSVGLAWRISQEHFISENEKLSSVLNNLKLRLGYGETGNSSCQPSHIAYVSKWNTTNSSYDVFKYNSYINKNLSWETNKQFNVGLNVGLWNRIDLSLDGFYKKNEDLLLKPELPSYVAPTDGGWEYLNTAYVNAGSIKNVGFDISLNTTNIVDTLLNQPFSWSSDITFSVVRNEVVDLGSSTEAITQSSDPSGDYKMFSTSLDINRSVKGEAPGKFYGYKALGIIQNTAELQAYIAETGRSANVGDIKYSTEQDWIGDPNPDFTWGFGNNFNWGPWSLGIQISGSYGNDVYNLIRQRIEAQDGYCKWINQTADVLDFARVATNADGTQYVINSNTSIPRYEATDANENGTKVSDRYVEDGSFVKLQNISLTYTLPKKYCEKMKIDNLHVSAGCSNVYTFTGYSGYDPENPGSAIRQGVDEGRYPSPRTYSVGLGFNF